MTRQFPDKKTVGIPPDFVAYRNDAQRFSEQAQRSAEEAARVVDASKALVNAEIERSEKQRKLYADTEWKRVIAENERKAAELKRKRAMAAITSELDCYRRGLNALGALVNTRDYMLLGDTLHLSPNVASFDGETLILEGAQIVDGVLVIDGQLYK